MLLYVDVGKDEPCYVTPLSVVAVLPNTPRAGSLIVLKDSKHPLASNLTPTEVIERLQGDSK